jgi:antitoxin component YwqK of YwqJK toxin-antitoxin module
MLMYNLNHFSMKKIFLVLFALSFIGFQLNAQDITYQDLEVKDGIVYKKGEKNPFTGICIDRWENGFMMEVRAFRNGKLHGEKKSFYENGNLKTLQVYGMGEPVSKESKWAKEGNLLYGPGFSGMKNEYQPQYQDSPARSLDINNDGSGNNKQQQQQQEKNLGDQIYDEAPQTSSKSSNYHAREVLYHVVDIALNVGILLLTMALYY